MGMFVNNVRDIRQRRVIRNNKRSGFTCRRFVGDEDDKMK